MAAFQPCTAEQFNHSPFTLIGKQWMLITAEKDGKVNTMTASWGGLGELWHKNAAYLVVRPERYTREFLDAADTFSLTFFDESYRKTLNYLGTVSGRDEDKIVKAGLTVAHDGPTPYFEQAQYALICRKMYAQQLEEDCFVDRSLLKQWYDGDGLHILYIGDVQKILCRA